MAKRSDVLGALQGVGTGFSKMGQLIMERERMDTQTALQQEENERAKAAEARKAELHPFEKEMSQAQAGTAKTMASEALITADKRKAADDANQSMMAENAAAGWTLDPEDSGNLPTWKAELNTLNRFRAKENKPALSVQEFVTTKKQEKFDRTAATSKEGRAAAESAAGLKETGARTKLLEFQASGAKDQANRDRFKELVDKEGNVHRWNVDTNEIAPVGIKKSTPGSQPVDPQDAVGQAEVGLGIIDQMIGKEDGSVKEHPGFRDAVGNKLMVGAFAGGLKDKPIEGTDAADFMSLYEQITGQAFMTAFQNLRGGGQITQQEGDKATAAITRMKTSQSEGEFIKSANEFRAIIRAGVERAKRKGAAPAAGAGPAAPAKPKEDPLGLF